MTTPVPKLTVDVAADHSCNWKCCLWCCPEQKARQVEEIKPVSPSSVVDDVKYETSTVETTTRVYKQHRQRKRTPEIPQRTLEEKNAMAAYQIPEQKDSYE